jgi:hypothetical protein
VFPSTSTHTSLSHTRCATPSGFSTAHIKSFPHESCPGLPFAWVHHHLTFPYGGCSF